MIGNLANCDIPETFPFKYLSPPKLYNIVKMQTPCAIMSLYKVVNIFEGKVSEVKDGLDLRNSDNMLGWLYNLIVGFSVDGGAKGVFTLKNNEIKLPTIITLNIIFGGYIKGLSSTEEDIRLYPAGVKYYVENKHDDKKNSKYSPLKITPRRGYYQSIENYYQRILSYGYRYFYIFNLLSLN